MQRTRGGQWGLSAVRDDLESFLIPSGCLQPCRSQALGCPGLPPAPWAHHPSGLGLAELQTLSTAGAGTQPHSFWVDGSSEVFGPPHYGFLPSRTPPGLKDGGHPRVSGSQSYQVLEPQWFWFLSRVLLTLSLPLPSPQLLPWDSTRAVGSGHQGTAPRWCQLSQ